MQLTEIQDRELEVGRDADRLLEHALRIVRMAGLAGYLREQTQGIDVPRILPQHAPVNPLGLLDAAFLLMFGGEGHVAALRRKLEALLEGGVCLLAAAEQRRAPCRG